MLQRRSYESAPLIPIAHLTVYSNKIVCLHFHSTHTLKLHLSLPTDCMMTQTHCDTHFFFFFWGGGGGFEVEVASKYSTAKVLVVNQY